MRWSRAQRLTLTEKGRHAEASYQEGVEASRKNAGRSSFDTTLAAWAAPFGVRAEDGTFLAELKAGPISLSKLLDAFEGCGRSPAEMKAALERLISGGLVSSSDGP